MAEMTNPLPHADSTHQVTQDERSHYVRRLLQEIVKVYTMLRTPFDKAAVHETCKAFEYEVWSSCHSTDDYVRQIRGQVQSISKRGRCLLQQREFEVATTSTLQATTASPPSYEHHTPSATPEDSMRHLQRAHLQRALSNSWLKSRRKASRFRWEGRLDVQEEAYVRSVEKAAGNDIYEAVRNLHFNQLVTYEEQLRLSLHAEHRDWVAYDLSVVQDLLATLNPISAPQHHNQHDVQALLCQIEKVFKEKALFDYMWEMERCKSVYTSPSSKCPSYLAP
ncbi:hypothetical protein B5M09_007702 [Aphanomyces astaci]|nr:hypothetical protein B5M09_007702 [Aphanomyces astaci]